MKPTLMDLDELLLRPYKNRKICPGDVVVINQGEAKKIIHRVLSVNGDKIKTMGDNNPEPDPWVLCRDKIAGQVVYAIRQGRWIRVRGSFAGKLKVTYIRASQMFIRTAISFIKPYYYRIADSRKIKLKALRPKTIVFRQPQGKELQLHIGKLIIGRKRPGQSWNIKPPFRLFLDERYLQNELDNKSEPEKNIRKSYGG
jgi:hypothetical protein